MAIQYELLKNQLGNNPTGYHAMVSNQRIYSRDELIDMMLNRGTSLTRSDIEAVLTCQEEVTGQIIKNGEGVNTGIYTIHIDIKGNFPDASSHFDPSNNSLVININATKQLKKLLSEVAVERVYSSGQEPKITTVKDILSKTHDDILSPGGPVTVYGHKIKVQAGVPSTEKEGIYAISDEDATESKFATEVSNMPSELIYIAPALKAGKYRLEVRTYYSGSEVRKALLSIASEAVFTVS